MMRSRRRQQPIAPTRLRAVVGAGAVQERAASAAGTGPAEQQLLLLGQLPPQRGVLGAQHGVVFYTYCYAISISTGAVSHTYVNSWFIALNPILMVGHRV